MFLSSIGADQPAGTGPIAGLHAQEERLGRLPGVSVLVLRPAYFFENFYPTLGPIKHQGINGGAVAGILPLQERIENVGEDGDLQEVYDTERHLLYVACTRARDRLSISAVEPASEFMDDVSG